MGRSQRLLRYREGVDSEGYTAYERDEASLRTHAQQQASATLRGRNAGPACTTVPTPTGTPTVGQTLTCGNGVWAGTTGGGSITYARQWFRGNMEIAGATGTTRVLAAADAGHILQCRLTATDANGRTVQFSNRTAVIAAA
jgi:hypothetical protein